MGTRVAVGMGMSVHVLLSHLDNSEWAVRLKEPHEEECPGCEEARTVKKEDTYKRSPITPQSFKQK